MERKKRLKPYPHNFHGEEKEAWETGFLQGVGPTDNLSMTLADAVYGYDPLRMPYRPDRSDLLRISLLMGQKTKDTNSQKDVSENTKSFWRRFFGKKLVTI